MVFSTQEIVTDDHCQSTTERVLAGISSGQHLHHGRCCAVPAWPLPTLFSEIVPPGKLSLKVRSTPHWAVSPLHTHSAHMRGCPWAPTAGRLLYPHGWRRLRSLEAIHACPKAGTQGTGRFGASCIGKNTWKQLSLQSVRTEEHPAWWELAGRGRQGKRRLWSTSSAKLTLLFFPPFSFDIKQIEWMKGRCRHN